MTVRHCDLFHCCSDGEMASSIKVDSYRKMKGIERANSSKKKLKKEAKCLKNEMADRRRKEVEIAV